MMEILNQGIFIQWSLTTQSYTCEENVDWQLCEKETFIDGQNSITKSQNVIYLSATRNKYNR